MTAALLLSAVALTVGLSVAPQLHDWLHDVRDRANHECAVTLIATGKYQQSDAPVLVSLPQPAVQWGQIPSFHSVWVPAPFLGACIFEHAPPALS